MGVSMGYNMKQLCEKVGGKREQSIYRLIRENSEFAEVVKNNRSKTAGKVTYEEPVLAWLITYYNADSVKVVKRTNEDSEKIELLEEKIRIMERERDTLLEQLKQKDLQLTRKDEQIKEANENTGAALLALHQEQDRIKLLEAPKLSIWQRLFGKTTKEG